jgi:broad specificity phosphatase PhoE
MITHAHTEQEPSVATDAWRLSAKGEQQAMKLAQKPFWREVRRVVVSSEPKTLLTVSKATRCYRLPVWYDSRFDELRRSGWSENYRDQVAAAFAQPEQSVNGWESVECVRKRATTALLELQRRFYGETIAVVGHGLCLSILRSEILGHSFVDFVTWQRLSFASVACVTLEPPTLLADFELDMDAVR